MSALFQPVDRATPYLLPASFVFGVIKEVMGFRRFHLRGLAAVKGEWTLVCMAWNVKRLHGVVA